jgi:transcriptional regulator with XRE-family HTH domain
MTFKEKLVILRKMRGLTQDDFASAVGVSRQAVYKWESGQSYPEVPKLLEIKNLFNISIDELLDDNFDIPVPEKKKRKRAPKPEAAPAPKAEPVKAAPTPAPKAEPVKAAPAPAPKAEPVKAAPAPAPKAEPVKAAPAPAPKAEPVKAAPAPAPKAEPEVKPEPKVDSVPAPTEIDLNDLKESDENTKKVGFFGRIFGRK